MKGPVVSAPRIRPGGEGAHRGAPAALPLEVPHLRAEGLTEGRVADLPVPRFVEMLHHLVEGTDEEDEEEEEEEEDEEEEVEDTSLALSASVAVMEVAADAVL